ncbi:MAG: RND transporter, partial [Pseudomonadota bacterium]|nr:RND transporter [Pseudomonadota bacterium]
MKVSRFAVLGIVAGLTACAAGPSYRTPKPDTPPNFASRIAADSAASTPAMPTPDLATWWRALNDDELNSLVDRAVKSNLDLEIALDRLQQARTYEAVVVGYALPAVEASAAAG